MVNETLQQQYETVSHQIRTLIHVYCTVHI